MECTRAGGAAGQSPRLAKAVVWPAGAAGAVGAARGMGDCGLRTVDHGSRTADRRPRALDGSGGAQAETAPAPPRVLQHTGCARHGTWNATVRREPPPLPLGAAASLRGRDAAALTTLINRPHQPRQHGASHAACGGTASRVSACRPCHLAWRAPALRRRLRSCTRRAPAARCPRAPCIACLPPPSLV